MRIWFDTEFIERGCEHTIQIISIGMVREDGAELYLESSEFDPATASEWVRVNVLDKLGPESERMPRAEMRARIVEFCGDSPEFWAYFSAYDWVVLAQLMGSMADLPKTWPIWAHDLKQFAWSLGDPELPAQPLRAHNALVDARWNVEAWKHLEALAPVPERVAVPA